MTIKADYPIREGIPGGPEVNFENGLFQFVSCDPACILHIHKGLNATFPDENREGQMPEELLVLLKD